MPTISEIRTKYPQYKDMSDQQLGDALYKKFYSDMPRDQFDVKVGLSGHSHPEFDASKIPGYDPQTGMVEHNKSDSGVLAGLTSAVNGLPVVGPYLESGVENAAAGIGSLISGEPQAGIRQDMRGMVQSAQAANPITSTIGSVGGGVAGTLPLVLAAPAAFGAGGGGLVANMLAGGASGIALGGADAGVRSGGDPSEIEKGMLYGGAFGAGGPLAGKAIGAGVRSIANRFGPGASAAEQALGRAATADNVGDVAGRLADLGPEAMPMDLGPNLQRQAGALAATPGPGQEVVRSAIAARDAGANARIGNALDSTIGPSPSLTKIEGQIKTNMDALGPQYEEAFSKARRVDTSSIADSLDSKIINLRGDAQKAARRVRDMLNIEGTDTLDPNPYTLFQTRQAIDGLMATETNPKVIGLLSETRKAVDNRLSASVPGIKKVDARFQELARQREALQRGQQALESGRTAPRPAELAADVREGALSQGDTLGPSAVPLRLREGARAEIDRIVGTNANDRVALQRIIKGEGDWNRDRLATLFGQDKAQRIINVLDRERAFADTSNIVTRNSETAARSAAMQDIAPAAKQPGVIRSALNLRFGDTAADLGDKAIGGLKTAAQLKSNEELARLLTSRDPAAITRTIKMVQAAQRRGDISAARAKEMIQAMTVGAPMRRQPLEITVPVPTGR